MVNDYSLFIEACCVIKELREANYTVFTGWALCTVLEVVLL